MSPSAPEGEEPWMTFLEKEFISCEDGTVEHDIGLIIQNMLLSCGKSDRDSSSLARSTAYEIDTYYWERNQDSGPLFRFQESPDFVNVLYGIAIDISPYLPYDDAKQETLVKMVVEGRSIPPRPVKAWNGDRLIYPDDKRFCQLLDDAFSGIYAPEGREKLLTPAQWEEEFSQWVNFSAFIARCIAARIDDDEPDLCKYPSIDVPKGLEKVIPAGTRQNCRVMVAAQYILLAGKVMDEEWVRKPGRAKDKSGTEWELWSGCLEELMEKELSPKVHEAVIAAHKEIARLRSEPPPS